MPAAGAVGAAPPNIASGSVLADAPPGAGAARKAASGSPPLPAAGAPPSPNIASRLDDGAAVGEPSRSPRLKSTGSEPLDGAGGGAEAEPPMKPASGSADAEPDDGDGKSANGSKSSGSRLAVAGGSGGANAAEARAAGGGGANGGGGATTGAAAGRNDGIVPVGLESRAPPIRSANGSLAPGPLGPPSRS